MGKGVDLRALPPVTGHCFHARQRRVGGARVDLAGYWLDGDELRVGRITVGPGATVASRSALLPGTKIGRDAKSSRARP